MKMKNRKKLKDESSLKIKNKILQKRKGEKSYTCDRCSVEFTSRFNLNRHLRNVHKDNGKALKCKICNKWFYRSDNFSRHMKNIHPADGSREYFECWECGIKCRYKNALSRHISAIHESDENCYFECATCGSRYKYKNYLFEHIKKYCPRKRPEEALKCSLCGDYYKKKNIFQHYEEDHGVTIERENIRFTTAEEFFTWKKEMEISTNSSFIVSYSKNLRRYKAVTFRCHRSGAQIVKSSNRSRRLKLQGSKKLNAICPAEIKFREFYSDRACQVSFLKTHVGHDLSPKELSHIFLPKYERLHLAVDVICGVPLNRCIDDQNDDDILLSDFLSMPMNRVKLLTKKDLYSIEQSYNVNHSRGNETEDDVNNALSYETEIEDVGDNTENITEIDEIESLENFIDRYAYCFIYYKREGEPPDEKFPFLESSDIVVLFMSPSQELLLQKHGNNVILMDRTSSKNPLHFIMHTMLVLDYDGEGIPVAFCLTNRNDAAVMNVFLTSIKEKVGILEPKTLMTDTEGTYFNCWKSVMGVPPFHFFCSWHVKKIWEQDLTSRICVKEKRHEMRKAINDLLIEANVNTFYMLLAKFLSNDDSETSTFINYFRDIHSCRAPLWAYCFRKNTGLSTNLHIEAFCNTLKYLHSRIIKLTSLYLGLTSMLDYVKRHLMETNVKNIRGKMTHKLRLLRKAHDCYVDFAAKNEIRFEIEKDGEEWLIPSLQSSKDESAEHMYTVRKLLKTCPAEEDPDYGKCNLVCVDCRACAHMYCCTCVENVSKNHMCTHIHAVASIFQFQPTTSELEMNDKSKGKCSDKLECSITDAEFEDTKEDLLLVPAEKDSCEIVDLNDLEEYKEDLLKKIESVRSIIHVARNKNVLQIISELLAPLNRQSLSTES